MSRGAGLKHGASRVYIYSVKMRLTLPGLALLLVLPVSGQETTPAGSVDFTREILPVFRSRCFKCHGPKKQEGQLRLDVRAMAMLGGVQGKAILPGRGKESFLIQLLQTADDEERMPKDADPLPKEQIDRIRTWIDQGAVWPDAVAGKAELRTHWAYLKPARHPLPPVKNAAWIRNPVDRFVLARLEKEGVAPSPKADRYTLIKRLYYDLVGLPPEIEEVDAFVRDASPRAYEERVDRLLDSPHFGERWGRHWLDKARYADSDGYEKDRPRPDAWRYRDWVIDAINRDMPFDQFTTEQLAGDLLHNPTPMQRLATAFHRQTMTNTEGGTDKEQFRVEAVFDRVETTGAVWLGLTVGCTRCHNHKYDRLSQKEYYQLFAFFDNGDEGNTDVPISEEKWRAYEKARVKHAEDLKALRAKLAAARPGLEKELPAWEKAFQARLKNEAANAIRYHAFSGEKVKSAGKASFRKLKDGSYLVHGANPNSDTYTLTAASPAKGITGFRLEVLADTSLPSKKGPGRTDHGNFVLNGFKVRAGKKAIALHAPSADFSQKGWPVKGAIDGNAKTGWAVSPQFGKNHHALFLTKKPLDLAPGTRLTFTLEQKYGSRHTIGRFRIRVMTGTKAGMGIPEEVLSVLKIVPEKRSGKQRSRLLDYYATVAPATAKLAGRVASMEKGAPKPPVMTVRVIRQRTSGLRTTRIMRRGEFLQPQKAVRPGTQAVLHAFNPRRKGAPADRLDLARWIMSPDNPITPRVLVNHLWCALFGQGIVTTVNDFGVRGERPTHPKLLDWLATEFVRLGWSRKAMIRLIVTSATYRQSARTRKALKERDPQNYLLHRQNRFRVEAEIVRDLNLTVSGLLSRKIGGPSVFPPMPADVAALSYANNFRWKTSAGGDQYRRGMYTFFKRTSPHPNMMTFDCPDSNTTCLERNLSNTPLQALTVLNNQVFVEAAQAFSRRVLGRPGNDAARLARAFRMCVTRPPNASEVDRLERLLETNRAGFRDRAAEAAKLVGGKAAKGVPAEEQAAWVATVRVLLNLDEFITRE